MLRTSRQALADMIAECDARRPDEACGVLLGGSFESGPATRVMRSQAVENVWPEAGERTHRFAIDPLQQMNAERAAEAEGLSLVGFYHSHPVGPAVPSGFDLERAWPAYVYVIVGYESGPALPRAWVLDEAGAFVEHSIEIDD